MIMIMRGETKEGPGVGSRERQAVRIATLEVVAIEGALRKGEWATGETTERGRRGAARVP